MKSRTSILSVMAMGIVFAVSARAGDLNPPEGPVAPTMKTLSQVEPRTPVQSLPGDGSALHIISEPGSYYFTGDILGDVGKAGIRIETDNVTVDLNGFALAGVPGSASGIVAGTRKNLNIRNGTVRDWDQWGVSASDTVNSRFEDLRLSSNGTSGSHDGLKVGSGNVITGCISEGNKGHGFDAVLNCVFSNCAARANGVDGINVNDSVLSACTASGNMNHGIFADGGGCTIVNCTANNNGADGINSVQGSTITNCSVRSNGDAGIEACDSLIRGNTSGGNAGAAIDGCGSSTVIENHMY